MIDPWLDDWSDADQSGSGDQGGYPPQNADVDPGYGQGPPYADYGSPDESQAFGTTPRPVASSRQAYRGNTSAAALPQESLTVIFTNGRAPQEMQNYMISSSALTVLDRDHQEQIPLDQIDVAATQKANRARGINFQVPAPAGD